MITDSQRKNFVLCKILGLRYCRTILKVVTKGITSLRDPQLTPWKMSKVIGEIEKEAMNE